MQVPKPLAGSSILLAGADAGSLSRWTERLGDCGAEMVTARDRAALLHGWKSRAHAVLVVLLRGEAQLEWIRACRQMPDTGTPALLAVCASAWREQALLAGADECLDESVGDAELVHRVRHNLCIAGMAGEWERERRDHARTQRYCATGSFRFDPVTEALEFSPEAILCIGSQVPHAPRSLPEFLLRLNGEAREGVRAWMYACASGMGPTQLELNAAGSDGAQHSFQFTCGGLEKLGGHDVVHGFVEPRQPAPVASGLYKRFDAATQAHFLERLGLLLGRMRPGGEQLAVLSLHISLERLGALSKEALIHIRSVTAERLAEQTRDRDMLGDCSGDAQSENMAILLPGLARPHDAYRVARRLQEELRRPIAHAHGSHAVEVTLGIALAGMEASTPEALLLEAREAEQEARRERAGGIRFRSAALNATIAERIALETSLKQAIQQRAITVHYQPKVNLRSGRLSGFEALARWKHPTLGMISPGQFIPIAEETGLIVPLGELVLEEACKQAEQWRREGLPPVRMAVNLSGLHFRSPDLVGKVEMALRSTGFPAEMLEIELTESTLLQHGDATLSRLRQLKAMGVALSIDDFGTGYSSLAYLKRFPVDSLKIDQSFIRDVTQNPDDSAITTSILLMGKSLNLKVIAEGIETRAQLDFLKALDCDEGQGYLFGRPISHEEARRLVEKQILFDAA